MLYYSGLPQYLLLFENMFVVELLRTETHSGLFDEAYSTASLFNQSKKKLDYIIIHMLSVLLLLIHKGAFSVRQLVPC